MGAKMKTLFLLRSLSHYSYIESVVDHLQDVNFLVDKQWSKGQKDIHYLFLSHRLNKKFIQLNREIKNWLSYIGRNQSVYYEKRWRSYLPFWADLFRLKSVQKLLVSEDSICPDDNIVRQLKFQSPDVVVATPCNHRFSNEIEYIKAAKSLGIPTVIITLSWDNLTTKGLFHVVPDVLCVWSESQKKEAMEIHGIPEKNIVITGSPFFDKWIQPNFIDDEVSFKNNVGIHYAKRYCLYLGSSSKIAENETWLINHLKEVLDIDIVARPHPANKRHFKDLPVTVFPENPKLPETYWEKKELYNSIYHSEFVIGVNTSAMIDAIMIGKPCIALMSKEYEDTQENATHFKHMKNAMYISPLEDVECLARRILNGYDNMEAAREKFVKDYIHPYGPAGKNVADAIVSQCHSGANQTSL